MSIFITTAVLSAIGIIFIIVRHLDYVRNAASEDFSRRIRGTKSLRKTLREWILIPLIKIWDDKMRIWLYGNIEKGAHKFRGVVLKIERRILKFTNYIRGKREIGKNRNHSEYWKDIHNFKNGLDKEE